MDAQTIQLITEAISHLSGDTKESFIWWLFFHYGIYWFLYFFFLCIVAWAVVRGLRVLCDFTARGQLCSIARAYGSYIPLSVSELEHICEIIKKYRRS